MPLKIQLKKSQKIIINGAVLENASQRSVSLLIANDAAILRDSDILTPDDAVTPASRVYYALQCMYVFPEDAQGSHHKQFIKFMDHYEQAAPSSASITGAIRNMVEQGDLYHAVKKCQELIFHEKELLANVQEKLSR
ncbi:flagellar biosynthesis repressor FlbT [Magnetospira thiophila]